jgi:hypothetical protein
MPLRAKLSAQTLALRMPGEEKMHPVLRLYEDVLPDNGEAALPALPRMIFVVNGSVAIADRTLRDEDTFSGEGAVTLKAGTAGATICTGTKDRASAA